MPVVSTADEACDLQQHMVNDGYHHSTAGLVVSGYARFDHGLGLLPKRADGALASDKTCMSYSLSTE
jgi:hypothetical protein